jgi:hypothetical protein
MQRIRRLTSGFVLTLGLTLLLAACSSSDDGNGANGTNSTNATDKYAADRQACVDRINGFRATLNLPSLKRWTAEETCTDGQAKSDSESGKAHGAFGDCMEHAQDECPGWGSVKDTIQNCLQDMWNEGPGTDFSQHGHFLNMSSTSSTQVSCGFYETPDGKVWAVQNFR